MATVFHWSASAETSETSWQSRQSSHALVIDCRHGGAIKLASAYSLGSAGSTTAHCLEFEQTCLEHSKVMRNLRGALPTNIGPVCKTLQLCPHGCWGPTLQQLTWRRPKKQHVAHPCGPGKHDVEMQPTNIVIHSSRGTSRKQAGTIDGYTRSNGLALRRSAGQKIGMAGLETTSSDVILPST